MAWQGLRGLLFLHAQNHIHRDLKPANMLINHKVRVQLETQIPPKYLKFDCWYVPHVV